MTRTIHRILILLVCQFVRSNTRRFMPSQADEEAHQLSYLQKHMPNILALLGQPVEGEGEESLVGRERHGQCDGSVIFLEITFRLAVQ